MRKLFTLAAAVLASVSMFAADYEPTAVYKVGDETTLGAQWKDAKQKANYFEVADTIVMSPFVLYQSAAKDWQEWTGSVGAGSSGTTWNAISGRCFLGSAAMFNSDAKIATVRSSRIYKYNVTNCTQVMALVKTSSSITMTMSAYEIVESTVATEASKTATYKSGSNGIISIEELDATKTYRIEILTDNSGSNSSLYEIAFVHPHPCTDPEFTVSPTEGTGFVGEAIDIAVTSKNQSKPVNYALTVDGVEGVYGTDYTFKVSTGLVQATPLKAGTFVITFSQASDGTYCDAEESATFVISAKSPVTSFEIDAPATAHIGEEVTIELKNFDAAPTTIVWYDGDLNEITAANGKTSYTFTPAAAGDYAFQVTAWNAYNALNEEAFNYTIITVAVGTDATLSDLKVNGATIDGFAADKYEYNVELGVYEALNVEATAADAPYASAEVVDNGEGKITITVTAQDKSTQAYVINYTRDAATELASISASATWDFTKTGAKEVKFTDETIVKKGVTEFNFADVLTSPDASFNAAALNGIGEYAVREGKYFQGSYLKFQTTVPGKLEVIYCNTGNRDADKGLERILTVNGTKIGEGALRSDTDVTESNIAINAGSVEISSVLKSDESIQYIRVKKVTFTKDEETALDNTEASVKAVKFFQNGQLFIEKNGKVYTIIGSEIR